MIRNIFALFFGVGSGLLCYFFMGDLANLAYEKLLFNLEVGGSSGKEVYATQPVGDLFVFVISMCVAALITALISDPSFTKITEAALVFSCLLVVGTVSVVNFSFGDVYYPVEYQLILDIILIFLSLSAIYILSEAKPERAISKSLQNLLLFSIGAIGVAVPFYYAGAMIGLRLGLIENQSVEGMAEWGKALAALVGVVSTLSPAFKERFSK